MAPHCPGEARRRDGAVVEWARPEAGGIHHGYVVLQAPAAATSLRVDLVLDGAQATVADNGQSARLTADGAVFRYDGLTAWDADGAVLATRLEGGGTGISLVVDDGAARYPVTIDPLFRPDWDTIDGSQFQEFLGSAVASGGDVDGDGYDEVLVGSPNWDGTGSNQGKAQLFFGSPTGIEQPAAWFAEGAQTDSYLGVAVELSDLTGDGLAEVIAAAPRADSTGGDDGRVSVWRGASPTPAVTAAWTHSPGGNTAYYGQALGSAGDVDGDGFGDLLIGEPGWGVGQPEEGRVDVHIGGNVGLEAAPTWTWESNQTGAGEGLTVAAAGDLNGDGVADLAVGVPGWNDTDVDVGRVLVFLGGVGGLASSPDGVLDGGEAGDLFGTGLASAGDADGDGDSELFVGAPGVATAAGAGAGRARLFPGGPSGPSELPIWTLDGEQTLGALGTRGGTPESCNGRDDDCDPSTDEATDSDGDGYAPCDGDCWEGNPAVGPGVIEACDGFDADCDGLLPPEEVDGDIDGFAPCEGDCDDEVQTTSPVGVELCDGVDQNCDGEAGPPAEDDPDQDSWSSCDGDCGPFVPWIGPGRPELCDGLDDDCDGSPSPWEEDGDGDGWTRCAGDCDDEDEASWPGAPEDLAGAVDHNCDGFLGDTDADGDGYPLSAGDCHDGMAAVHPGATERCDGWDTDCDGQIGAEERIDADGDGAVTCLDCGPTDPLVGPAAAERCDGLDDDCDGLPMPPGELDLDGDGLIACAGDCDDNNPLVRLGLAEDCDDGLDNDCEGSIDVNSDHDHDGVSSCAGDCRDFDEGIFPGAVERCDGLDEDCDQVIDNGWDNDGDGQTACAGDCDDGAETVWLGAPAICDDGLDNDCLPSTQELIDADGDGFAACGSPGDCWEGNPTVAPGAPENCNGVDEDCDGLIDEGWDIDEDEFRLCAFDCEDSVAPDHPGAQERCEDEVDNDCDGEIDEGCQVDPTPEPEPPPAGVVCTGAVGSGALGWWAIAGVGAALLARRRRGSRVTE